MDYLKNAWYVAAWSDEIKPGQLFSRRILDQAIVFFRQSDGTLAAIADRCPHRFAPLHMGALTGDCIQCPYHGLQFAGDGRCTHNPHGDGAIPKAARVRAYAVTERHLAVWIWMGEPDAADPAKIPDYSFIAAAKTTARTTGYLPTGANYELLTDNIMDLTHVDFLHPTTLGGGALSRAKAQVSQAGEQVRICWEARGEVAPPSFAKHLSDPRARADLKTEVVWNPPALMCISVYAATAGQPFEQGYIAKALHLMTPESDTSTHYFFANTRNVRTDDGDYNQQHYKVMLGVFSGEDKPMVEGQQRNMNTTDLMSLKPVLLAGDAGPMRVRRILGRLIQEESSRPALSS